MVVSILVTRCDWSGKVPRRSMWSSLDPGRAVCACGASQVVEQAAGMFPVFPVHGRGQCYAGHCEAWPYGVEVVFDEEGKH